MEHVEYMQFDDMEKYIGGIFDFSGSIYISNNTVSISITHVSRPFLQAINSFYNGIFNMNGNRLVLNGKKLLPVLKHLQKYSIIKAEHIKIASEYIKIIGIRGISEKRKNYENQMKLLNKNTHFEINNISTQYIAGLFEVKGTIGIYNKSYSVIINQHTSPEINIVLQSGYNDSLLSCDMKKVSFNTASSIRNFLIDLLPFLIYKKDQAQLMLDYLITTDTSQKISIRNNIKHCKKLSMSSMTNSECIQYILSDLMNNYNYNELILYKKYKELEKIYHGDFDSNKIYNKFNVDDLKRMKIKLIFCNDKHTKKEWKYFRNITSSIPSTGHAFRYVEIIVLDETSGCYLGMMSLSSDCYALSARDKFIKNETGCTSVQEYNNDIANLSCCVPLQPFGYNCNGGKLLVNLAFTKEVFDHWKAKYNVALKGISTMSINGKGVMYDRLKCIKHLGYTIGVSAAHIPQEVIDICRNISSELDINIKRTGTYDKISALLSVLKLNKKYLLHGVKRGFYFGWMFSTKLSDNYNINELKSIDDIHSQWLNRWSLKRVQRLTSENKLKLEPTILTTKSDIFKGVKMYVQPLK